MYTAQNESEACAFLESVFFPNREREKEKERKSFEWCFFFCFVKAMMTNISLFHWNPSFFLFVCFDGSLWWRTCSEPICRGRRSMPKEGGVERRLFFLPSFRILSCATFVVSARIQRRWWPQNLSRFIWSFQAYLIIASALSLRTYIRDTFFSLIRSLTQYFLHTHKNTHTDAHRKHSFRWKHAGCIERKHILW